VLSHVSVNPLTVTQAEHTLLQIEDDGDRQPLVLTRDGQSLLSGLGLHIRRVEHREPARSEPFPRHVIERVERVLGCGLVVLVVGDEGPVGVGAENFGRLEVSTSEGGLAAPGRADEDDQGQLGDGEPHGRGSVLREILSACAGTP